MDVTGLKLKDFVKQHRGLFWVVVIALLAFFLLAFNLFRPRDIRISGRIDGTQKGQLIDVRVMFFDTDDGANAIKTAEYDNVLTTSDGRFDLVYTTSLASLPGNSYMQLCIRNAEADSYGAIPICAETSELSSPSRVQGETSDNNAIVSCTRKLINGSVPGVLERAFGFAPEVYEFYEYCRDVYTETEHTARLNSVNTLSSIDRATLDGDTFITIDSIVEQAADPQMLELAGNTLTITEGNSVQLPVQTFIDTNSDEQLLSLEGTTISIQNGNSITLPEPEDPEPINISLGVGLSGSASVELGDTLSLSNTGILGINTAGPITSTGGQNPTIDLTLCADGQVLQVSGGAWACNTTAGTYTFSISDGVTTQGIASADQILFSSGTGLTASVSATDTVTFGIAAGGVGTNEIANGSVANVDLANSEVTITAGSGLSGGGNVSLGGSIALSNSGVLTVGATGPVTSTGGQNPNIALAACAGGEILKYNGGLGVWECAVDVDTDTDTQDLSLLGNTLSLINGGSVDLSGYLDNTDAQDLTLTGNTLAISGDPNTDVDLSGFLDDTTIPDDQTLSIDGSNNLIIADGNSVSLLPYLDNTDAQDLTLTGNTLAVSGDPNTDVDLSGYLDNTDAQAISVASDILSITGNAGTVDLSVYLDNTDSQALSLSTNTLSLVNGGSVDLSGYLDNTDAQDLTLTGNTLAISGDPNTDVDLSAYLDDTTIPDDQTLSIDGSNNLIIADGNSVSLLAYLDNTDAQDLTLTGNTLAISGDPNTDVDLSGYLDNTDSQAISVASDILSITGDAGTVDLSVYLDNTDSQALSLSTNTLSLVNGGSVDLSGYLDNTDAQDLTLTGNTLALTNDGTTVDLSSYLDNTDQLASLSCSLNEIAKWNGAAWACATDVDTDTDTDTQDLSLLGNILSLVDGGSVDLSGYLDNTDTLAGLSCGSGQVAQWNGSTWICANAGVDTDDQTLSIDGSNNLIIADGNSVSLAAYLDNTDAQDLTLSGNTLGVSGDPNTDVDLSGYLDNTDAQAISVASDILSISGNASTVDLSVYLDNTDSQALSLSTNTLSLVNGGSVDLSGYLDNTDAQDLTLSGNTLAISGDPNTDVDLSAYLDDTTIPDDQTLSIDGSDNLIIADGNSVSLLPYLDNTDTLAGLSCGSGQVAQWNGSTWICASAAVDTDDQTLSIDGSDNLIIVDGNSVSLTPYLDNTDSQAISVASDILSITGDAGTVDLSVYLDNTDSQALSLSTNTLSLVNGGSVDLSGYLDNTDAQDLTLTGNTLAISGDPNTDVDLSAYLDDTTIPDDQTLSIDGSNNLIIADGNSVSLLAYLDNTDAQDLTLTGNTLAVSGDPNTDVDLSGYLDNTDSQAISVASDILSITGDAGTVDLSVYLDNTDSQALSLSTNTLSLVNGGSVDLSGYLDNTDAQDLTLTGNTLAISGDPNTDVDLSAYLDDTTIPDDQTLSIDGSDNLIIADGNSVSLLPYLDNTDTLAGLSCGSGQVAQWNGSTWICASAAVDTDDQTLSIDGSDNLIIVDGNSVSLTPYLDNTDSQAISVASDILSITGDAGTVDLSVYLDNTDSQALSLSTNTLSLVNGGSVDLSGYLDNTDAQDLTLTGNTLAVSGDPNTDVDLSIYLDDTTIPDDQTLSIDGSNNLIIADGNSVSLLAYLDNTDAQDLTLTGNTLAVSGDPNTDVDLSGYLDNTDSQAISVASDILSITGDAGTVDLSVYLDNTDSQALSLSTNTLSLVNGGSVDLSGYLDNTDAQDLTLTGNTLAISGDPNTDVDLSAYLDDTTIPDDQTLSIDGSDNLIIADGNSVSLLPYLDNTDTLAGLSCGSGQVAQWNGSTWVCASAAVDTDDQTLSIDGSDNLIIVDGNSVSLTPYLDNTDSQAISVASDILSITGDAGTVDLSVYLDNTDSQALSLSTNTLSLVNGGSVDLSGYLDNTDAQDLTLTGNTLAISGDPNTDVDLSIYLDDTTIADDQTLSIDGSNNLIIADGNSVSLLAYLDNTDAQDLTLTGNTLAVSGDPNTDVDLSGYLDNTDSQAISVASDILSITGDAGTVDLSVYLDNTDSQALSLSTNTLSLVNGGSVDLSGYLDNTDAQDLTLTGNTLAISGDPNTDVDLSIYLDDTTIADDQTLSIDGSNNLIIADGNSVSLLAYLDNTDAQDLTLTGNTLAVSGDPNTDVDLSGYLDNTDSQAISVASDILSITGDAGTVDLSVYLDNTDSQALSLSTNTLSLVNGGSVDLSGYLDNTDAQDLTLTGNTLAISGDPNTDVDLSIYLDDTTIADDQTLSIDGSNNLIIADGNSVSLLAYLDNTDAQDLTLTGNTLAVSGDPNTDVDLSGYLDNTDSQAISVASDILSITGDAGTVDLSVYLDNTDSQALSLSTNTLSIVNGGSVDLSGYLDNTDAQDLTLTGNTLAISGDPNTDVDLSIYLDDTTIADDQTLSIDGSNNLIIADGNSVSLLAYLDNTDAQDLTLTGNTLAVSGDPNTDVDLSGYLDNTDSQAISVASDILSITGDAGTVDLSVYLDNTDSQALSLSTNTLSLVNGGSVDLSGYLDNTDAQDLTLTGNTLAISGDPNTDVDLSIYLDDTTIADDQTLSIDGSNNLIIADGNSVSLLAYLDNTDAQDLTLTGNTLAVSGDPNTDVDLSGYLDNTDSQAISVASDILSITGDAGTVDLSVYLDNTDSQALSLSTNTLSLVNGGSVDLSGYLDNTDAQDLTLTGNTLAISGDPNTDVDLSIYLDDTTIADDQTLSIDGSNNLIIADGNSVSLLAYLDNTDAQDLTLTGNTLAVSGDPNTDVDLSGYLDNTDSQAISVASDILSITGDAGTVDLSVYLDNTDSQALSLSTNTLSLVNGGSVDLSGYLDNTDAQDLTLTGNTLAISGDPNTDVDLSGYLDDTTIPDDQTLSIDGSNNLIIADGNSVSLLAYLDNTDAQDLTLTGNTLAVSGDPNTDVDLSGYLDNTDSQAISVASDILSITGDAGTVDLSPYLDNTDSQALSLSTNTLSLVNGGSVDLSGYLDNVDTNVDITDGVTTQNVTDGESITFADGTNTDAVVSATNTVTIDVVDDPTFAGLVTLNGNVELEAGDTFTVAGDAIDEFVGTGLQLVSGDLQAVLGTTIETAEITDSNVTNAKLANDSVTVTAGSGLTDGGAVALGSSVTVNIGAGSGITVNADDVAVDVITTGSTGTTSSNSGLEASADGVRLLGGCADGDVLAWNDSSNVWQCASNASIYTAVTSADQVIGNTTTLTNVTDMNFPIPADEEWYFEFVIQLNGDSQDDLNVAITCPAGATASFGVEGVEQTNSEGNLDCGTRSGLIGLPNADEVVVISGTVENSTTAGTVQLQLSENTTADAANNITVYDGSSLYAARIPIGNLISGGAGGGGGGTYSFDITDTTNTETISDGDQVTFAAGTGVTVLVSSTDTVTYTAVLGASIETAEIGDDQVTGAKIADGEVSNAKLANSSLTVTAGSGLTNGGVVSLGGSVTLDIGAGNGVVVNANDVGLDVITTGTTASIGSNSGLEVGSDGLRLLGGCADGEALVWNSTAEEWECGGLGAPTLQGVAAFGYVNGTTGALNAGDGASISRTAAGSYTVTFDTAESDANYIVLLTVEDDRAGRDDINITVDNQATTGFDVTVREGDNGTTADVLIDQDWYFQVLASDGVAGGGAGTPTFNLTDGSNTEVINDGDNLTLSTGAGLTFLVSATDTATVSIDTGGITSTYILNGTILFEDIGANGCTNGQAMVYNGSAWACDSVITTEVDGVVGNEILNATVGGGLVRSGTGTGGDPFTLGIRTDCATDDYLSWSGSAWTCQSRFPIAQVRDGAGGTSLNTGTPTAVPWNTQDIIESGITHSTVTANTQVQLDAIGTYRVSYTINGDKDTANTRAVVGCQIRVNGVTTLNEGTSYSYNRNSTNDSASNVATALITTTAINDYIEIVCSQTGDATTVLAIANESWITVERIR